MDSANGNQVSRRFKPKMDSSEYVLIGNKNSHRVSSRQNSDRGTLDIKKEYTGGTSDVKKTLLFYPDLQAAIDRVDELSEEPEYDPTDPIQPRPEPEDDDSDSGGGFLIPTSRRIQFGSKCRLLWWVVRVDEWIKMQKPNPLSIHLWW